jgi:hypothetical protein
MGGFAGGAEQGSPSQAVEPTSRADTPQLVATASADEFHVALDRCEFPVFVWTPPEGGINLANQAATELFNVPLEQSEVRCSRTPVHPPSGLDLPEV